MLVSACVTLMTKDSRLNALGFCELVWRGHVIGGSSQSQSNHWDLAISCSPHLCFLSGGLWFRCDCTTTFHVKNLELLLVRNNPDRRLAGLVVCKAREEGNGSVWRVLRKRTWVEAMAMNSTPRTVAVVEDFGSPKLKALADRLRLYRAAPSRWASAEEETHGQAHDAKGKRAAVLVCLFQGAEGDLRVILTKRAGALSSHSGEVALPGGKRDEGEDDIATALREAHEEIALHPSHVHIVTLLQPFLSKHLLTVTPVVAILPEYHKFEPRPNAGEVDAIFDVPLEMFLKNEGHHVEEMRWLNVCTRVHCFAFVAADGNKYRIWGFTAGILIHAASVILQRQPDFPEDLPDFGALIDAFKSSC